LAYVQTLAQHAAARGSRIFERSAVLDIGKQRRTVRTENGQVSASEIVLATHSPTGFHVVQAGMVPSREYGLAAPIAAGSFPAGIFWIDGAEPLSVRSVETTAGAFLICVGQQHKTGQHDAVQAMQALERVARQKLAIEQIAYRWSAQNYRSPDGLPYIGRDASGMHIATGFGTDGLVYGTLAAMIITDQIRNAP